MLKFLSFLLLFCLLIGCAPQTAVSIVTPLPVATIPKIESASVSFVPATFTAVPTNTPTPTATHTPLPATATPLPSATPDVYQNLTIAALQARHYGGGAIDIVDTIEETETFTRYLITYPSDGLTIYGYMNVPHEGDNFPVVLMLHGYMPVDTYETVTYTKRYADDLAEAGYFVIHPSFRNHPPSDNGPNPFRVGYALDVLNLIAIIREQSLDDFGYLRRADAENIHLWGHSMGGGVALRVATVLDEADYLKTAVLYAAMSGDEEQNYEKIRQWRGGQGVDFEMGASPEYLAQISPIHFLEQMNIEVQVHHSLADDVVPVQWSEELCDELDALDLPHRCHFYEAVPHTFRGLADLQFMERVRLFYGKY